MSVAPSVPSELQEPLYAAIAEELIALSPEPWKSVLLEVSVTTSPEGVLGMPHTISSPEGHREAIMANEELFGLTYKLLCLFREYGKAWKTIRFEVWQLPEENWRFRCDFTY